MKGMIEQATGRLGIAVYSETHATVPFFLAETRQLLVNLVKQGAVSIDMELSVLSTLANRYEKKTAGIIRIGDLPLRGSTDMEISFLQTAT